MVDWYNSPMHLLMFVVVINIAMMWTTKLVKGKKGTSNMSWFELIVCDRCYAHFGCHSSRWSTLSHDCEKARELKGRRPNPFMICNWTITYGWIWHKTWPTLELKISIRNLRPIRRDDNRGYNNLRPPLVWDIWCIEPAKKVINQDCWLESGLHKSVWATSCCYVQRWKGEEMDESILLSFASDWYHMHNHNC